VLVLFQCRQALSWELGDGGQSMQADKRPDGHGDTSVVARLKIDEWAQLDRVR
jgi:hypothetical protein